MPLLLYKSKDMTETPNKKPHLIHHVRITETPRITNP